MSKEREYHALLSVYGIQSMDKRTQKRLVNWLRSVADEFEEYQGKEFKKVFADNFRARLMKK